MKRFYGYFNEIVAVCCTVPGNRGINVSLMCIISKNGVIAWETKQSAYNTELFIERKIIPYATTNPEIAL
jgi:hypothetical protein